MISTFKFLAGISIFLVPLLLIAGAPIMPTLVALGLTLTFVKLSETATVRGWV